MELKDLILETLNELSLPSSPQAQGTEQHTDLDSLSKETHQGTLEPTHHSHTFANQAQSKEALREECEFLEMLQERLLVLFDGLNAPQNKSTPERLNITINFLEYQLSVIQERLNDLKK